MRQAFYSRYVLCTLSYVCLTLASSDIWVGSRRGVGALSRIDLLHTRTQPQLGAVPLPMLPGLGHFVAEAPALGQHTADVLAELG